MIYETIKLWDNQDFYKPEPGAFEPFMTVYSISNMTEVNPNQKRPAILILPGGGYNMVSQRESEPIMTQFLSQGYTVAILKYSVNPAKYPTQLLEVSRAMWLLRAESEKYQVDVDKIAVIGFSAGGHLSAHLGVSWNKAFISETIGMPAGMNQPNALILSYAVISSKFFPHKGSFNSLLGEDATDAQLDEVSCELHVGPHTPPTFLWHSADDNCVPVENTLRFALALSANDIPFEVHIYPEGQHGLSIGTNDVGSPNEHCAAWIPACQKWTNTTLQNKQY
ncbi:MAG: alpha/beta hydrolase [Clostridia bacterium]